MKHALTLALGGALVLSACATTVPPAQTARLGRLFPGAG